MQIASDFAYCRTLYADRKNGRNFPFVITCIHLLLGLRQQPDSYSMHLSTYSYYIYTHIQDTLIFFSAKWKRQTWFLQMRNRQSNEYSNKKIRQKRTHRGRKKAANKCFSLLLHVIQFNVNNYVKCNPGKFTISRIFFLSSLPHFCSFPFLFFFCFYFYFVQFYLVPFDSLVAHAHLFIFTNVCSGIKLVWRGSPKNRVAFYI